MTYVEVSRITVTGSTLFIEYGLYAQAWKIWRTHSARDFAPVWLLALLLNEIAWFNYGICIREWPLIVLPAANIPAIAAILLGGWRYGFGDKDPLAARGGMEPAKELMKVDAELS